LGRIVKTLTAEIAEHAEGRMAKGPRPRMHREKMHKISKGFHEKISALSASSSLIL
jgi:hypothetical protein